MNADGEKHIEGNFHAVSLSGGKDSTAMLLLMIEQDMPIDVVLTADTGMEFPEMYEHLQNWTTCSAVSVASISLPCGTPKALNGSCLRNQR